MPNVGIHFVLAGMVLDRWAAQPAEAPFPSADEAARSAFLHGAVAPDLGYFPAGDRLFSELVHLVRTADFARGLLAGAASATQRGYAWGWATHVLADLAIHPPINRAAEEVLVRQPRADADPLAPVLAHMRVEYGLDVAIVGRHPRIEQLRFTHALAPDAIDLVARTFTRAYALPLDEDRLRRAHVMSERVSRAGLAYGRVMTATLGRRPLHAVARSLLRGARMPLRAAPSSLRRSPFLMAVVDPVPPTSRLLAEVDAAVSGFADRFAAHCAQRLERLDNCDLVLGGIADPARPSPRTALALEELARRRARSA